MQGDECYLSIQCGTMRANASEKQNAPARIQASRARRADGVHWAFDSSRYLRLPCLRRNFRTISFVIALAADNSFRLWIHRPAPVPVLVVSGLQKSFEYDYEKAEAVGLRKVNG